MSSHYLKSCKWEDTIKGPRYIYDKEKAERNFKEIKKNIDNKMAYPIDFKWSNDGYEVPFGRDCYLNYGEIMPDGVIRDYSIFHRDPYGDFPWMGNYYSLNAPLVCQCDPTPTAFDEYDKEIEDRLKLYREFGTPMKSFTKDNSTTIN